MPIRMSRTGAPGCRTAPLHARPEGTTVIEHQDMPALSATPLPEQDAALLIADVAALTGVPPPQLRSWEQAGLLHPRRAPNAIRVYGIEDVARARLIKRSLVN